MISDLHPQRYTFQGEKSLNELLDHIHITSSCENFPILDYTSVNQFFYYYPYLKQTISKRNEGCMPKIQKFLKSLLE